MVLFFMMRFNTQIGVWWHLNIQTRVDYSTPTVTSFISTAKSLRKCAIKYNCHPTYFVGERMIIFIFFSFSFLHFKMIKYTKISMKNEHDIKRGFFSSRNSKMVYIHKHKQKQLNDSGDWIWKNHVVDNFEQKIKVKINGSKYGRSRVRHI